MPRFRLNLDELRQDVRFATRTSLASPGFSVAALMLGLAIGGATSVHATADWLLDRSPGGVVAPDRVVALSLSEAGRHDMDGRYGFSFPQYEALREVQDAFTETAGYAKVVRIASDGDWTEEVVHQFVTGSYFPMLGVRPHLGRLIGPEDDLDGTVPRALISHAFWRSHFGGDPDVVGRTMTFALDPVRIIGVLPPESFRSWGG